MPLEFTPGKSPCVCRVKHCRRSPGKKNVICGKHSMERWREQNPVKAAFASLRDHAKLRNKLFKLTFTEFENFCLESGYHLTRGRFGNDFQIDRIKNHLGYSIDNIRILTCSQNTIKGNRERYSTYQSDNENPF